MIQIGHLRTRRRGEPRNMSTIIGASFGIAMRLEKCGTTIAQENLCEPEQITTIAPMESKFLSMMTRSNHDRILALCLHRGADSARACEGDRQAAGTLACNPQPFKFVIYWR